MSEWSEGRRVRIYTDEQRERKNKYNRELYQKKKEYIKLYGIEYRKNNKDKESARAKKYQQENKEQCKITRIKRTYGLTKEAYLKLVTLNDNKCFLCNKEGEILHIDHDHSTGIVRKLLCKSCNLALGLFKDDPELLLKAAQYIKDHKYE